MNYIFFIIATLTSTQPAYEVGRVKNLPQKVCFESGAQQRKATVAIRELYLPHWRLQATDNFPLSLASSA